MGADELDTEIPSSPGRVAFERALAGEREAATHWRALAVKRQADSSARRRRPLMRLAERIDRWITSACHPVRRIRRAAAGRLLLAGHALVARPRRPPTKDRADRAGAHLFASPHASVSPSILTDPVVEILRLGVGGAGAIDLALAETEADVVCLLDPSIEPFSEDWTAALAAELGPRVGAVTAPLVAADRPWHRATPWDGLLRSAGVEVRVDDDGRPLLRYRRGGDQPQVVAGSPDQVLASSAGCVAIDVAAFRRVGGFRNGWTLDLAMVDLCLRLRADGVATRCLAVPIGIDHRPIADWVSMVGPVSDDDPGWLRLIDEHGSALLAEVSPAAASSVGRPEKFVLTIGAPMAKVASRWGDWHLAQALAEELERSGYSALVQTAEDADAPVGRICDVHLVIRGLVPVRATAGQRQVLWVISHPESVTGDECDAADLVLVASRRFAEELQARTTTPVEVLLQATDHRRFRPVPAVARHYHEVTIVAKSRDVLRPMVADALAAGIRPAIYGGGWDGLVDPALIVADHVDNADLPQVYSSAQVVLNDHWDAMRTRGFVSNRVFDVAACGVPLVTDDLPEIGELFGDLISTWRTPQDLASAVGVVLADPEEAAARSRAARQVVLENHTFEVRTGELLAILVRHGVVAPKGPAHN